jgi:hypothetical protein
MPSTPLQLGAIVYVLVGLLLKGIVVFRGMKWRRSIHTGGPLWDAKDNSRNALFVFLAMADFHPVAIVLQILLWPAWLVWLVISSQRIQKLLQDDNGWKQ